MNLLAFEFGWLALGGALIVGLTAPAVGIYLVQRRMSLIGDGLGHVALTGVAIGFLLQQSPVVTAVVTAAVGGIVIELIRERGRTSGDLALALLFYGGIAGGVLLVGLSSQNSNANLMSYLFGSLLSTSRGDLVAISVLGAVVLAVTLVARPWLFAVCHDEEYARVAGLPVRALNLVLAVTAAVTVTVAMRAVGLLLVSALMVVPVATAQQLARGFSATMYGAMAIGVVVAGAGVFLAADIDVQPGAAIVVLAIGVYGVVAVAGQVWRRMRRPVPPVTEPEPPDVVLASR